MMVKVLIVEDSRVVSEYLQFILSSDPEIEVIGNVSNGKLAIEFLTMTKPDLITMDIDMPIMNGLEATRIIMEKYPTPIIIVTGNGNANQVETSINALSAGALSVIDKPVGNGHEKEGEIAEKLITMVKLMAEVRVITRKPKKIIPELAAKQIVRYPSVDDFKKRKIIAIGISSGGPPVLQQIFSKITTRFPIPIVVVQHITEGFLAGLVKWLETTTSINISIASDNEMLAPGKIYFAPDNCHMLLSSFGKVKLDERKVKNGICPSVGFLFNSLVKEYGRNAAAFLLTGMGSDGAVELKLLRDAGSLTVAQDKESSLVHGMPGSAIKLDAAEFILNPSEIAEILYNVELSFTKSY